MIGGGGLFMLYMLWTPGPPILDMVSISTDKTEYEQGETVEITLKNRIDKPIWYADFGCYPWWKLEKQGGENWQLIEVLPPTLTKYGEGCIACPPPESIDEVLEQLQPNSEISKTWDLRKCEGATPMFINSGNYRLVFDYGFSKDSWNEEKIYSNKFAIKAKEITCLGLNEKQCRNQSPCVPLGEAIVTYFEEGETETFSFKECVDRVPEYATCKEVVKMTQMRGGSQYPKECRCCCGEGPFCKNRPYPER